MSIRREGKKNIIIDKDIPLPLKATIIRTVRFQEVDMMGVVWHGHYAEYFEDGRCALGKVYGLSYDDFFRERIKAPLVNFEIEYMHPLLFGETFQVETSLLWTEAVRFNHLYVIRRETDGLVVSQGSTVQLLLDAEDNLLMAWPEYFQRLRKRWKRGELASKDG